MTKSRSTADVRNLADTNATDISNVEDTARYKNYVDNPSMAVSQENGDGPVSPAAGISHYTADRWETSFTAGSGAAISCERGTLNNFKTIKQTATTAATTLTTTEAVRGFFYYPEAQDVFSLNGKQVTFSFKANVNWNGNLPICISNYDESRSYTVDCAVTSGENDCSVTLTLEAGTVDAADNGRGMTIFIGYNNEGSLQTATTGTWQAGIFPCSTNSTMWSKTVNNFVEITEVQLVEGDTAPKFQPNSYAEDLAKCLRYYELFDFPDAGTTITIAQATGSGTGISDFNYSRKRTTPTITNTGTFSATLSTGGNAGGTFSYSRINTTNARLSFSGASGLTAGHASSVITTSATIAVDARL